MGPRTRIEFHFNVHEGRLHACRLLRKVMGQGLKSVVTGEEADLQQLDQLLWTFSPLDFLPHRWAHQPDDGSPITLAVDPAVLEPGDAVLVNLGHGVPRGFESWTRLLEIVTLDDLARNAARQRWRHYTGLGYSLGQHDLSKGSA